MRASKAVKAAVIAAACAASMGQSDCSTRRASDADRRQAAQTRELQSEADRQVGMPGMTNFTERRIVRQLYELRDQDGLSTYTYVVDYTGRLWHVCDSTGYGIPFSAQFSNPETEAYRTTQGGHGTLPQPEPNGLWVPESSSATWVICASPDGEFRPLYVEPSITVSPFPLNAHGSWSKTPVVEEAAEPGE